MNQRRPCRFPTYIVSRVQGLKLLPALLVVEATPPILDFQPFICTCG